MKKKNYKKIGREPIPKVTCRMCRQQVEYDAMEVHAQIYHPEFYEDRIKEVEQWLSNGMSIEEIERRILAHA